MIELYVWLDDFNNVNTKRKSVGKEEVKEKISLKIFSLFNRDFCLLEKSLFVYF